MGKAERKELILTFMADHGLALPPTVVCRNMKDSDKYTVPFSDRTVKRLLGELAEEGHLKKVFDNGYYQITDQGRQALNE